MLQNVLDAMVTNPSYRFIKLIIKMGNSIQCMSLSWKCVYKPNKAIGEMTYFIRNSEENKKWQRMPLRLFVCQ